MIQLTIFSGIADFFRSVKWNGLPQGLSSLLPAELAGGFLEKLLWLAVVLWGCGVAARLLKGKGSGFSRVISISLSIQFTYLLAIALYALLPVLRSDLYWLPFTQVTESGFLVRELGQAPEGVLTTGVVRLAILSLLVAILEDWMPRVKKLLPWLGWRVLNAGLSLAVYSFLTLVLNASAPQCFGLTGMGVVLILWGLVVLAAVLRGMLGIVMASVPRAVEKLHSFFYSREKDKGAGRTFARSALSALFFLLVMMLLNRDGLGAFAFADLSPVTLAGAIGVILVTMKLYSDIF